MSTRHAPPRRALVPDARLLVVILSYRTPALVVDCLRSLEPEVRALGGAVEVVVVDNDSGPESVAHMSRAIEEQGWGRWAWLLPLPTNGGYAAGNNVGLRIGLARGEPLRYVHLLNPDTRVRPGALAALLAFMDANPRAGIAGSRCLGEDGRAQASAFRFFSLPAEVERGVRLGLLTRVLSRWVVTPAPEAPARVDWVTGASMIVRRETLDRIGLLDEGFFLYFEETDFCRRANAAGIEVWYVPASEVVHMAGAATGVTGVHKTQKRAPDYLFQSRRRYWEKGHGVLGAAAADWLLVASLGLWRARVAIERRPEQDPPGYFQDIVRHALHLPAGRETPAGQPLPAAQRNQNPAGLFPLLLEDWRTHERRVTDPGFLALALHRLRQARLDFPSPVSAALGALERAGRDALGRATGIHLDPAARVGRRVRIVAPGPAVLMAAEVGDDVQVRPGASVGLVRQGGERRRPVLEDGVQVGPGAAVLGDIRIGRAAVVGANAVVTSDVPADAIVAGAPAREVPAPPSGARSFAGAP